MCLGCMNMTLSNGNVEIKLVKKLIRWHNANNAIEIKQILMRS